MAYRFEYSKLNTPDEVKEYLENRGTIHTLKVRFKHLSESDYERGVNLACQFIIEYPEVKMGTKKGHFIYKAWLDEHKERYDKEIERREEAYKLNKMTQEGKSSYEDWVNRKREHWEEYVKHLEGEMEDWKIKLNEDEENQKFKMEHPTKWQEWYNSNLEKYQSEIDKRKEEGAFEQWLSERESIERKKFPSFGEWNRENRRDPKERVALDMVQNYLYSLGITYT